MTTQKWATPATINSPLTTELNSLANGSLSGAGPEVDNETDLYFYMEIEITLASLAPTGTPYVSIFMIKQIDAAGYEDLSVSRAESIIATASMSTATAAKRMIIANIVIPPSKFKLALYNATGVALASSGNTVKARRYNEQSV